MNKLLTNIQDDSLSNHRQFDKMINFVASSSHYGNFANYDLTKGTTQKIIEYFSPDRTWTITAWCKGVFYWGSAGGISPNDVGLVFERVYYELTNNNNTSQKLKLQVITHGNLSNLFFAISNDGSGNAANVKIYSFAVELNSTGTPAIIINNTLTVPYANYAVSTRGGIARNKNNPSNYINMSFADFRAWDKELTPAQIHQVYTGGWQQDVRNGDLIFRLPATLAGTHFDSNTPTGKCRVLDISGNANHMILENMGTTPNLVAF